MERRDHHRRSFIACALVVVLNVHFGPFLVFADDTRDSETSLNSLLAKLADEESRFQHYSATVKVTDHHPKLDPRQSIENIRRARRQSSRDTNRHGSREESYPVVPGRPGIRAANHDFLVRRNEDCRAEDGQGHENGVSRAAGKGV